jgi:hypothetical protein
MADAVSELAPAPTWEFTREPASDVTPELLEPAPETATESSWGVVSEMVAEFFLEVVSKLAADHGRATTRAVHPAISSTVSRAAVADRLRMGFDKRRPPPLALVAAWLNRVGVDRSAVPPCGPYGSRPKRNQEVPPAPPRCLTCEAARGLRLDREILPRVFRARGEPPKKPTKPKVLVLEAPKKWRSRDASVALWQRLTGGAPGPRGQMRLRFSKPRAITRA